MSTAKASLPNRSEQEHVQNTEDAQEDFSVLLSEISDSVESYCRRRPGVVAGVLFGLGFFCGWKLRPW